MRTWISSGRLIAAGLMAAVLGLSVAAALASAPFDHAHPGPEEVVPTAPSQVDFYTSAPTSPQPANTQVIVTGPDGRQADLNASAVDPADHRHVIVPMKPNAQAGRYVVSYKTRGETDLEFDGGAYAYYVGGQPTAADRRADTSLNRTVGNEFGVSVTGLRRGLIDGGIPLLIGIPAGVYYWRRRRNRSDEAELSEHK